VRERRKDEESRKVLVFEDLLAVKLTKLSGVILKASFYLKIAIPVNFIFSISNRAFWLVKRFGGVLFDIETNSVSVLL